MLEKYARQVYKFFYKYNINIIKYYDKEEFINLLIEHVDESGNGFNNFSKFNPAFVARDLKRKVPIEIYNIKPKSKKWIRFIILYSNPCPICGNLKKDINNTTCSHSCANTYFRSGKNHPNYTGNDYRKICFDKYLYKCLVCDESNVVDVHHLDENRDNNDIYNLIPLCPTHHRYIHSKELKKEILEEIRKKLK